MDPSVVHIRAADGRGPLWWAYECVPTSRSPKAPPAGAPLRYLHLRRQAPPSGMTESGGRATHAWLRVRHQCTCDA
eukprot:COSAG01_NODE_33312_length_566_cov_1.404711_1_plen_75_part_10